MTTPAMDRLQLPAIQYDAVPANPHTGGLYSAATMLTPSDADRMEGGVEVWPVNEGTYGEWQTGCGPQDDPDAEKTGERANARYAPSFIAWTVDQCGLIGSSDAEAQQRALQIFRLNEQIAAERNTAPRLLEEAGTVGTAPVAAEPEAFVSAVGALEEALGLTGTNGVIHARRAFAATAARFGLALQGTGGALVTPLGNRWAFGAGYSALGNVLVGTGPVTVRRAEIVSRSAVGHRRNERTALAERMVNVSWEITTLGQATA